MRAEPLCVIVTGGARRIGATIARRLAADGHLVVIHHHRSVDAAEALAAEIGQGAVAIEQDLALADAGPRLIKAARAATGRPVSGLVNNASLFEHDFPPLRSGEAMARAMAVNLTAPVMLASAMATQDDLKRGWIVNILDQKLANLNPDFFSYSCSKAALAAATVMLSQALAPRIAVNAVAPGITLPSHDQTAEEFEIVAGINLLGRPNKPEQVADAVAFLSTCQGISGQTLYVDHGQHFLARDRDVMFSTRGEMALG